MSVIFFGSGEFAVPALEMLAGSPWRPLLAVTRPDRPGRRGLSSMPTPVRAKAVALGLPVEAPASANEPEFLEKLRALDPEVLIVVDYGEILRGGLLALPQIGIFNLHASLLPRHRGAAPVQAAILAGDAETGVTLFRIVKGLDSGPIVGRVRTPAGPLETAGELEARLSRMAADLLATDLPRILEGSFSEEPQRDEDATFAPKIPKGAGGIDWSREPDEIARFVRAMSPAPGAFAFLERAGSIGGEKPRLRLLRAVPVTSDAIPGTAPGIPGGLETAGTEGLRVTCGRDGSGRIDVLEVQPAGKKVLKATEFLLGARLRPGDRLAPG
jgi:methionyl-tRNA formyltransferase